MITYPQIDPVALALGPLKIRWYGLMYLVGFAIAWFLARSRARRPEFGWKVEWVDDLIFYLAVGLIVGARIGYMLFYGMAGIIADPLSMIRVWEGGMSFHGGLLGVALAIWLFGRKVGKSFFETADFVAPLAPLGLCAGRIGNFINGELWGKTTDVPWAFVVDGVPRHATQLYEAGLEGIALFVILWLYSGRRPPTMAISGAFLLIYGVFRFSVEFVRVPDAHLGYLALDWVTMGQILTTPMILIGLLLLFLAYRTPAAARSH
ncbi:MAG: prolipoprotein diacylglyceryl transferase [Gammaproteobacteria bacterium]|jgi:phosphatidylglycerol:prolipoprotein diacylglycerol transferase